jgi:AcrR family transcriptional regulator
VDPVGLPPLEDFTPSQAAILRACVELFGDRGFSGTSVRDIAASVGIKSASLYKSFASKQAMLDALSELGHNEFAKRQLKAVLSAGDDPRDQLTAGVRCLVAVTCEYPRLSRIVNSEVRNLSPRGFDRDQTARVQSAQILYDVLERGRAQGVFIDEDFALVPVVLWSLGVGLARWWPYSVDITVDELADTYAQLALRIVGAEPHAAGSNGRRGE